MGAGLRSSVNCQYSVALRKDTGILWARFWAFRQQIDICSLMLISKSLWYHGRDTVCVRLYECFENGLALRQKYTNQMHACERAGDINAIYDDSSKALPRYMLSTPIILSTNAAYAGLPVRG